MAARPTFGDCVMAAARTPELVENFDRLTGSRVAALARRTPLEQMIDEATGHERAEILKFLAFVYDMVYLRLPESHG